MVQVKNAAARPGDPSSCHLEPLPSGEREEVRRPRQPRGNAIVATQQRVEDAGVIEGYAVRVNPEKVGLSETVILHVTLDSHSDEALFEFGKTLEEIPEVLEAYLVSGDYDYYIRVAVEGTRGYERFLRERLYKIPGIRHSKSSFVLRRLKQSQLPIRR